MQTIGRLISYVMVAGGLSALMVYGAIWLVRPDPMLRAEAHVAPIPARIADSIARKRDDLAVEAAADAQARMEKAALEKPVVQPVAAEPSAMKEANVSLVATPERAPLRKPARIKAKPELTANLPPAQIETAAEVNEVETPRPVARRVSTARSDFPY